MAREIERKSEASARANSSASEHSIVESIKAICAYNARAELFDEKQLVLFLKSWWSRTYNRPLKDPLLATYSTEELLYEFYDKIERRLAEEERVNSDADKIEEDKEKAVLDWAEQEELKEIESLKAQAGVHASESTQNPAEDPNNVAWMEEQIAKAKEIYGDTFGEDIHGEFDE
jgi:hypothetical protein